MQSNLTKDYATSLVMQLGHQMVDPEANAEYMERHDIRAAANLTAEDDEFACLIAAHLADRITGKTVVEIGGGTGLLAIHLAGIAERVFCIKANPVWLHVELFMNRKPKNLSYLFGCADEFVGLIGATSSCSAGIRPSRT